MLHSKHSHHEQLISLPQILALTAPALSVGYYVFKQYVQGDKPKDKDESENTDTTNL